MRVQITKETRNQNRSSVTFHLYNIIRHTALINPNHNFKCHTVMLNQIQSSHKKYSYVIPRTTFGLHDQKSTVTALNSLNEYTAQGSLK